MILLQSHVRERQVSSASVAGKWPNALNKLALLYLSRLEKMQVVKFWKLPFTYLIYLVFVIMYHGYWYHFFRARLR